MYTTHVDAVGVANLADELVKKENNNNHEAISNDTYRREITRQKFNIKMRLKIKYINFFYK